MSMPSASSSRELDRVSIVFAAHLQTPGGTPYGNMQITWSSLDPGGAIELPSSLTNPVSGDASVTARAGFAPGTYRFTARFRTIHGDDVPGSPATYLLTATQPAAGTIFTMANVDQGNAGNFGIPGYAIDANIGAVSAMLTASDGTLWFADSGGYIRTLRPSDGYITTVIGAGGAAPLGDGGPLLAAGLSSPSGIVLDETNHILYIAEQGRQRIRKADLANDRIYTLAGGGSKTTAPYGDGGPGTDATFGQLYTIALGADGAVYTNDVSRYEIRRIDPVPPNNVTSFLATTGNPCTGGIVLSACDSACQLVAQGNVLVIAGSVCGGAIGTTPTPGVVQRETNGTFTHLAGKVGGATTDGTAPTAFTFTALKAIAFDGATMYLGEVGRIRKVAGGAVTTIGGTGVAGFAGDYLAATDPAVRLGAAPAFGVLPGGHLVIGDFQYHVLRVIW